MTNHAIGTFEVKLNPQDDGPDAPTGRMTIDKQFQGDLHATSKGQMIMSGSPSVNGSAGYVAIEKVTGTLHGRSGSFYLQHNGTMTRGVQLQAFCTRDGIGYAFVATAAEDGFAAAEPAFRAALAGFRFDGDAA